MKIRIPTREHWKENSVMNEVEVSVFTDGSITIKGVEAGVYVERLNISSNIDLKMNETSHK